MEVKKTHVGAYGIIINDNNAKKKPLPPIPSQK